MEGSASGQRLDDRARRGRASVFAISITPFAPDGSFDEDLVRLHLRRLGQAGVGVYLGGGGSGEGYVLTRDETRRLLELGVEELKGSVPVRAMGTEPRTSKEMIGFIAMAGDCGVDATQIYSLDQGHGHRPTMREIRTYLEDVLDSTDLPVVISTHQSVGYQIPVDMLSNLVDRFPNIVGINSSHQDLAYLSRIIDALPDRVDVHVGGPQQALTAWSLGATGYLSSEANLIPQTCVEVVERYRSGDAAGMCETFGAVLRTSMALYNAGGIRATKAVLGAFGLPGGPPRRPQMPVEQETVDGLVALIRSMGLDGELSASV